MQLTIAFFCLVVGVVLYALPLNSKINELGRLMFFCGLFVTLWAVGGRGLQF